MTVLSWRSKTHFPKLCLKNINLSALQVPPTPFLFSKKSYAASENYYMSRENRREFFEKLAAANNFDPLVPEDWYNLPANKFYVVKVYLINSLWACSLLQGAQTLASYYKTGFVGAVMDCFPDIGLEADKFPRAPRKITFLYKVRTKCCRRILGQDQQAKILGALRSSK